MDDLAPIILFVYNRIWHTQKTVKSLLENKLADRSKLYIFSDGPKNGTDERAVSEVRQFIKNIIGFGYVEIIERQTNFGLANNVIAGVSEILKKYDKAIIMEDDVISSENFLMFMNKCLNFYENEQRIFSISGYTFPINIPNSYKEEVLISFRSSSWGWGTWRNRWEKVDWAVSDYKKFKQDRQAQKLFNRGGDDLSPMLHDQMKNRINSWAIRWAYAHFKNNAFCLYPVKSKIANIGTDNTGTHSINTDKFIVDLDNDGGDTEPKADIQLNEDIVNGFKVFSHRNLIRRILNFFKLKIFI